MRLLLINYEYPPVGGGAANATANIARAMSLLGHEVLVLTANYAARPSRSTDGNVTVLRVRAPRKRTDRSNLFEMGAFVASAAFSLPGILRSEAPDGAVVFFSLPCGPLGLLGQSWAKLPYVISLRGGDVPGTESSMAALYKWLAPIRRLVLRRSIAVVANSASLKRLSEATDPIPVDVIPNGVDTDFYVPARRPPDSPFTFLFVGRFQNQKNLPFLLDGIAALRKRSSVPFRLVMVGDGPLHGPMHSRCVSLGLDDVVTWHGWCAKSELVEHYGNADCFLNPSLFEGMPNTVLEAMACGLPVIASDVVGNDATVLDGGTGYLINLARPDEFVAAMRALLENPSRAKALGAAGRQRTVGDFSWESVARSYVYLFSRAKHAG